MYQDNDVISGLPALNRQGKEALIDSVQDDDVESDEEVTSNGI